MRILAFDAGSRRRLAVGTGLDVATHRKDQSLRSGRDLGDRLLEGLGVALRRLPKPADLADVLAGGRFDLAGGGGIVLMAEGTNASAHARSLPQACSEARAGGCAGAPVVMRTLFPDRPDRR